MKKLYILKLIDDWRWDTVQAMVIRASNEKEARILASQNSESEGDDVWLSIKHSTCAEIDVNGVTEIICKDRK